jgi:hypothetical protein
VQRTPQETLMKIKTQDVVLPANLSPGALSFMHACLVSAVEVRPVAGWCVGMIGALTRFRMIVT